MQEEYSRTVLSVWEVALLLSLENQIPTAKALINGVGVKADIGDLEKYFMVASHGMIARGLLGINPEDGSTVIQDEFRSLMEPLFKADFSIRMDLFSEEMVLPQTMAFHFQNGKILGHEIDAGIVHQMTQLGKIEEVIDGMMSFFGIDANSKVVMKADQSFVLSNRDMEDEEHISDALKEAKVSVETINCFLKDIKDKRSTRGTIIAVQYGPKGELLLGKSFRLFCHERIWLFTSNDDITEPKTQVECLPSNQVQIRFKELVESYVSSTLSKGIICI